MRSGSDFIGLILQPLCHWKSGIILSNSPFLISLLAYLLLTIPEVLAPYRYGYEQSPPLMAEKNHILT
jgi:hypothetical protein